MDKFTAIYVRRSVSDADKGNNSLSIASQKDDCIKYITARYRDSDYKIYCDDGKSGKDIEHRPAFQQMICDVKDGLIERIVIKKYDRFSRNIREFLNIAYELEKFDVSVISIAEQFETETKEGRMMRNNLLSFAEFERETIAARVADAYNTKARETGFYQGGKMYYGYVSSRQTINGKEGSVLVPSPQAYSVTKAYEIYAEPNTSLLNVIEYFQKNGVDTGVMRKGKKSNLDRAHLSRLLESPLYVKADAEVYRYLSAKGVETLDDISAYDGIHGLFLHGRFGGNGKMFVKVGYHEGLVEPSVWLAVQDKKTHNEKIPRHKGAAYTWLGGLVKCAHCGYALCIQHRSNADGSKEWLSYRDRGAYTANGCIKKTLKIRPHNVEDAVLEAMKEHLRDFEIAKKERQQPSAEVAELIREVTKISIDIESLMDKLADADDVLFSYIQDRIKVLHSKKNECEQRLRSLNRRQREVDITPLSEPLSRWEELTVDEKNTVAVKIIEVVKVSDETGIEIIFQF
ncbi:MAG: recombinase family protein [Ruminococcus sp.]|nr:recombinase family protein [Ruminococcus sp.]